MEKRIAQMIASADPERASARPASSPQPSGRKVDRFDRRRFLRGVGGVAMALPALEVFAPRRAHAQAAKIYTMFMCEQNGTVPERFYPSTLGPLNAASMMGSAVEDLIPHAADIMVVRGVSWTHGNGVGCGHSSGCNTSLTASRATGRSNRSLPTRESADLRISELLGRGEPLNLYSGRKSSYLGDAFAYGPGGRVRPADNNPWNVYQRLMGLDRANMTTPGLSDRIGPRQKSINDLVRVQLNDLLKRTTLSMEDRRRLDLHLQSVRDLENTMSQPTQPVSGSSDAGALSAQLMRLRDNPATNEVMEDATKAQLTIIALAFATDQTQIATLQVGGGNSGMQYLVDGRMSPSHHFISHRVMSDGSSGQSIPNAVDLHFKITRIHSRFFKHFIDQVKALKTADGRPLLDATAAVWMNSLSNGPPHGTNNVPHVIAGTAGGFLKKGVYVDSGSSRNSQFLNTMITAAIGGRSAPMAVTNFGDAGVPTGLIPAMQA